MQNSLTMAGKCMPIVTHKLFLSPIQLHMADQEPNQFRVNVDKYTYDSLLSQHAPRTNRPEYSFAFSLSLSLSFYSTPFNAITQF